VCTEISQTHASYPFGMLKVAGGKQCSEPVQNIQLCTPTNCQILFQVFL